MLSKMTRGQAANFCGAAQCRTRAHRQTQLNQSEMETKIMPKQKPTPEKLAPRRGTLASYRRENAHIQRMVLANLTPEQRMQLSTTRGNPHIEARVSRLITALDRADQVLHSL